MKSVSRCETLQSGLGTRRSVRSLSAEMLFLRESGVLGTSATECGSVYTELSPACLTPRLFNQWQTVKIDTSLPKELKTAFIAASRRRDFHLLSRVFKELRLETVMGRLADRYYRNRLKHRLFRVMQIAYRLPKAIDTIANVVRAGCFAKYRKKVRGKRAKWMYSKRLWRNSATAWKRAVCIGKYERQRIFLAKSTAFRSLAVGVGLRHIERSTKLRILAPIVSAWKQNAAELKQTRYYFRLLTHFCQMHRSKRISRSVKVSISTARLEELYKQRIATAFLYQLKEWADLRHSRRNESCDRLHKHKRALLQLMFSSWSSRTTLDLSPIILKKKVFRAVRKTLVFIRNRKVVQTHERELTRRVMFRDWLQLIRSGKYMQIHTADDHYTTHLLIRSFSMLKFTAESAASNSLLASKTNRNRLLRKLWTTLINFSTQKKSLRYYNSFLRYRKTVYVRTWQIFANKAAEFHKKVLESAVANRKRQVMRAWRCASAFFKKKTEETMRIIALHIGFSLIQRITICHKMKTLKRYQQKRIFSAWKDVISTIKYYQSRSMTLSVPARLKSKKKVWKREEWESTKLRQLAIKRAVRVFAGWKQRINQRKGAAEIGKKKVWRVKKICFARMFVWYYFAFREKMSQERYSRKCCERGFGTWKRLWTLRKCEKAANKSLSMMRKRSALLHFHKISQSSIKQTLAMTSAQQLWTQKSELRALRTLFVHSKKYFVARFIRRKLLISQRPHLLSTAFHAFKILFYHRLARDAVSHKRISTYKKRCFTALQAHRLKLIPVRNMRIRYLQRTARQALKLWNSVASISSALADCQFEVAAFLAKNAFKSALQWVSASYQQQNSMKTSLKCLSRYKQQRRILEKREVEAVTGIIRRRLKIMVKTWRVIAVSHCYEIRNRINHMNSALKRLHRHSKIEKYMRARRSAVISSLFLLWKSVNAMSSTHHFLKFQCGLPMFRNLEKRQVFAAWKRKVASKPLISRWVDIRQDRLVQAVWVIMKRVKTQLAIDRERTFQLRKDLVLELKRLFKSNKLAVLFRGRKLALKGLKAWRLETVAAISTRRYDTEPRGPDPAHSISAGLEANLESLESEQSTSSHHLPPTKSQRARGKPVTKQPLETKGCSQKTTQPRYSTRPADSYSLSSSASESVIALPSKDRHQRVSSIVRREITRSSHRS